MAESELNAAARLAVREEVTRTLTRWMTYLGVGTIVSIAGGLFYIYSAFGDQAIVEARNQTEQFLVSRSELVDGRIERALERAETLDRQTSELFGKAEILGEQIDSTRDEAARITAELKDIEDTAVVTALTDFLTVSNETGNSASILRRVTNLEDAGYKQVEVGELLPNPVELAQLNDNSASMNEDGSCSETAIFRGVQERSVDFDEPFAEPPSVQLALQNLDAYTADGNFRISMIATDVTRSGFKASLVTWCDTRIYRVSATWVAVSN